MTLRPLFVTQVYEASLAGAPGFAAFLRETYEVVRPGREEVHVDDFLAGVLAGG